MKQERLTLSIPQAGRLLGISHGAVYRAVEDGSVPTVTVGKRQRVVRALLEQMLGKEIDMAALRYAPHSSRVSQAVADPANAHKTCRALAKELDVSFQAVWAARKRAAERSKS